MVMKELQDFPKIPIELMERLMNLTLRYFEERSRVSCMYLSFLIIIKIIICPRGGSQVLVDSLP